MPENIPMSYGGKHELPANFREVDEAEFAQKAMRRIYAPERMEYRQFHGLRRENPELPPDLQLAWYHNGKGDAIYCDYWAKRVRFFLFAECEHEFTSRNVGRCLNEYTCKKCGYQETIDSSD